MTNYKAILEELTEELQSCLHYLEHSYLKVNSKGLDLHTKDPESLEAWEALVSRFARTTDIFISKYLRAFAEKDDPGFRGSLVDTIYYAEKRSLIDEAKVWIEIRELRNRIAHEYAAVDLSIIFELVLKNTPQVLTLRQKIK